MILQKKEKPPIHIGPYQILRMIGKGGMGEVYLARDPICERDVALKRIKPSFKDKKTVRDRFIREAQVTSHLSHPSIIGILNIHSSEEDIYYTMPYAEGETLRRILYTTREQERLGRPLHPIGRSIPSLTRIFLQICQAIAYTHAKGILHRDLKPENVIVGKYGEVMILDWGLANFIDKLKVEKDPEVEINDPTVTRPGKIAGTLAYMAPEILTGKGPSIQTDIYALGVILYQLLTLQIPFTRKSISTFRKQVNREEIVEPIEMAPHRDIPHHLAAVAIRCISKNPLNRYSTVEELISDIKKYVEGRAEWIPMGSLNIERDQDWQLEENILLPKHIAITKTLDSTSWAALKISTNSFVDNIKIETTLSLSRDSQGLGFLFSLPLADERRSLEEGYCLWLGSKTNPGHRLFRDNVQVLEAKCIYLEPHTKYDIRIEKVEDQIKLYIDDLLKMSFIGYLPLAGSHVGFIHKDGNFSISEIHISSGSMNAMVNCLAVPGAFLSHKLYDLAFQEYLRIGQSFPGRMEGREALFRGGLTLLEKGKATGDTSLFQSALEQFEKLYKTPGAPLEYLGKSLVYQAMNDSEEEAKCLELALRKFPKHPLLPMIQEHVIFRMNESSLKTREAAYRIIFLAIRNIPNLRGISDIDELLESLEENWEALPFIVKDTDKLTQIAITLCFWLKKVPALVEIGKELMKEELFNKPLLGNILYCLIELGAEDQLKPFPLVESINRIYFPLTQEVPKKWDKKEMRVFYSLIRRGIEDRSYHDLSICFENLKKVEMPKEDRALFDSYEILMYLLQKHPKKGESLFRKYPSSVLTQENSPLHFPFGIWLYLVKGPKLANVHFKSVLETPYPPTAALPSHFLSERIDEEKGWIETAFYWEKKELYRQLKLFHAIVKKE